MLLAFLKVIGLSSTQVLPERELPAEGHLHGFRPKGLFPVLPSLDLLCPLHHCRDLQPEPRLRLHSDERCEGGELQQGDCGFYIKGE